MAYSSADYNDPRYQQGYPPASSNPAGSYRDPRHYDYGRDGYLPQRDTHQRPPQQQHDFPPPPRSELGHEDVSDRPYAPSEPRPTEGNQLAPYDEEKAYAEYCNAYGPPPPEGGYPADRRGPPAPPSSHIDYGGGERRRHSDRQYDDRDDRRYDDRDDRHYDDRDDRRYDERDDRRYDDRPRYSERNRDREYERSRYDDRSAFYDDYYDRRPPRHAAHDAPPRRSPPKSGGTGKDILRQGEGERGIGATLLGGAAGAFLGDQADKGPLGTIGGAVLGAIAAKAGEKQFEKHKEDKEGKTEARRRYDSEYSAGGGGPYTQGGSHRSSRVSEEARYGGGPGRRPRRRRGGDSSEDSWTSED